MVNPILQMMNVTNLLANKNPEQLFNQMLKTNPQFADFVEKNKDKPVEQVAKENGIDFSLIQQFLK